MRRTASETIKNIKVAQFDSTDNYNKGTLSFYAVTEKNTYEDGSVKEETHYVKEDNRTNTSMWHSYTTYLTEKHLKAAIARARKSQDWN